MLVIIPGHRYLLENLDKLNNVGQEIQFIQKDKDEEGLFVTINDGTTNEEVIEVLVNRLNYLNKQFPCRENAIAITHLETALLWLNKRTADRLKRNVEGKPLA